MTGQPERAWITWRRASILTSLPAKVLRPLLREAGVDLFRVGRRELVDAEGLHRWMHSMRVPSGEEAARLQESIRQRVRERMAARRTAEASA